MGIAQIIIEKSLKRQTPNMRVDKDLKESEIYEGEGGGGNTYTAILITNMESTASTLLMIRAENMIDPTNPLKIMIDPTNAPSSYNYQFKFI